MPAEGNFKNNKIFYSLTTSPKNKSSANNSIRINN